MGGDPCGEANLSARGQDEREDAEGILASAAYATSLVDKEAASGVPRSRIVLAGFSQGGAIAYTAAMRMAAAPLGGDGPAPATAARAPRPGCAMRARADLRTNLRAAAAGVVALSTWLPRCARTTASDAAKATPFLVGHGDADPVVLYDWGKQSVAEAKSLGVADLDFKTYPGMQVRGPALPRRGVARCGAVRSKE